MYIEKLTEKLEADFNEGLSAYKNQNYEIAFMFLHSAYKISVELNNNIYKTKSAKLLKDVCYELAYSFYSKGLDFYESDAYSRASILLKKSMKLAKAGCYFEESFNEDKNKELLNIIKDLNTDNKKLIIERRQDRWVKFKDGAILVGDCVAGVIAGVFELVGDALTTSSDETTKTVESDIDESIQEDSNKIVSEDPIEVSSKKLELLKKIKSSYEESKSCYTISSRIDMLLDCHQIAKENKFSNTKEYLCDRIAYQYYCLGCDNYNEARSKLSEGYYETAKGYADDAKEYFGKAYYWVTDDSETNYAEDKADAINLWDEIDKLQKEDSYSKYDN